MADNALGNLFTEMAESIRDGLGYIGKMKPITFPDKVREIVALLEYYRTNGDNGDGESDSPLKFTSGSFIPTADRVRKTIEHGLGCMPDFIMVYAVGMPSGFDTGEAFVDAKPIVSAWGFRSCFDVKCLSYLGWPTAGWSNNQYGIDNVSETGRENGNIYCPDEATFQLGYQGESGSVGLSSGIQYNWIAVAGLGTVSEPVVQPLEITENGTYTAPDGVDGYNPVTVNVDSSKITILKEQEISGFALDADLGYIFTDNAPTYAIEEGEKYFVVWNGVTYETTAISADSFIPGALFMGNGTILGLPGNNEPFAIGYVNGMVLYTAFEDPSESHIVGIYQKVTAVSDDLRYVTFKSYDGLIEYGKKPVAVGDDCADPIARGIFATPTKESDAQYNYTFYGWATEPNGGADANWNKAITEDKTVYANFTSTVRYYTITYYDSDGTTVLKTESLAYGATPVYLPEKEGFGFAGWTPEIAQVTGNASYVAEWSEKIFFATASWSAIAELSESGEAQEHFAIGDTKQMEFNGEILTVAIADFNHDDLGDGSGKAGMSLVLMTLPSEQVVYNAGTNFVSYPSSTIHATTLKSWESYLPESLLAHIKGVKKAYRTSAVNNDSTSTSTMKLWLLSCAELGYTGTSTSIKTALGTRYPLFSATTNDYLPNETGQPYWLRQYGYTGGFAPCYVSTTRKVKSSTNPNSDTYYIRFGFCI